jgi:hypothetical protein
MEESGEWIGTMEASKRFGVSPAYLYKLAFEDEVIDYRTAAMGKTNLRRKVFYKVADLEKWYEGRNSHFKRKHQKNETPGQKVPAVA